MIIKHKYFVKQETHTDFSLTFDVEDNTITLAQDDKYIFIDEDGKDSLIVALLEIDEAI
jgi:hypothetical protein